MYEDVYGYPCPPPPPPRPPPPPLQSSWNADMDARRNYWPGAPHDFSRRPPPPMHLNRVNNGHHQGMQRPPWRYGESPDGPRHYPPRQRFNNNHFGPVSQPRWQRNNGWLKRPRPEHEAPPSNKRQKRLKGDCEWTRGDAERALQMEKDYMRKAKNNLLIIKFPDPELNKNIVCKLHPEIKDVHFQQQSTARFCFVTLQQTANPDEVIESLNRQKFGDGHLTASYKRDRDDDYVVHPEDIDPFTLYVGNLAKDVTEEDILKVYPKCRRIDISYAMRMKFTRYAFVVFRTLEDCTEAFRRTHSMEMNSKNLVIRFRRIHGHVGLPGKTKWRRQLRNSVPPPPPPPAVKDAEEVVQLDDDEEVVHPTPDLEPVVVKDETKPPEVVDVDVKPTVRQEYVSPFKSGSLDAAFAQIKPKVKRENVRVKNECDPVKQEPSHSQDSEDDPFCKLEACISLSESDEDDYVDDEGDECALEEATNFHNLYSNMLSRVNIYNSLKEMK